MLNNVLGVAVKPTFGVGLLYNFDHFDWPEDNKEVSVHQPRVCGLSAVMSLSLTLAVVVRASLLLPPPLLQ
jgi:hypothetical protein